jgi:hypothetical protein
VKDPDWFGPEYVGRKWSVGTSLLRFDFDRIEATFHAPAPATARSASGKAPGRTAGLRGMVHTAASALRTELRLHLPSLFASDSIGRCMTTVRWPASLHELDLCQCSDDELRARTA